MPIRWDTLLTRHVARELDRALVGSRLRAVRLDRPVRELTLLLRERALIWYLHPTRGDLRLHPAVEPKEGDHRLRGTLRGVHAPPDERLIRFDFSGGGGPTHSVIVELMSTRWNALVAEGGSALVRHVLWRSAGESRWTVGGGYGPPPPTGRAGVAGDVPLGQWLETLEPLAADRRRATLVRSFAWTSTLNEGHLLGEQAGPDETPGLELGHRRWKRLADPEVEAEPVLLDLESGPQPYPFPLADMSARPAESLLAGFEACAETAGPGQAASPSAVLGPELVAELEGRIGRVRRRIASLESELDSRDDPAALRAIGDLILARYVEIPPGAEAARLTGFDGQPVEVRLDPAEPAHANASRYYERATKAERAAERLPGIVGTARQELERLEELEERVRAGSADEAAVREALGPGRIPTQRDGAPSRSLPYRTFRSSGGLEIRVGRGARYNDDLTFRHSSPGDVWLHARHAAGAHVILRWQGPGKPPARDLREAATLAALHSKARTSGSVPVDWTLRKYVRKPRKAPPGQVTVERVETLFVEPDESVAERLTESEPG